MPQPIARVVNARGRQSCHWPLRVGNGALVQPGELDAGLHGRDIPALKGKGTRLSADSFTDEKTGLSYYTAEVTVPASELRILSSLRDGKFQLRAGMPVQILIPLRPRTALDYALEPLVGSFWSSFREH